MHFSFYSCVFDMMTHEVYINDSLVADISVAYFLLSEFGILGWNIPPESK